MYLCKHSDSFIAPVFIEVVFKEPMIKVTTANYSQHQTILMPTSEWETKVFLKWESWSPCSTCDKVGLKLRIGYCFVYQNNNNMFHLFEDGVPCRSQLLNAELKENPNVQSKLFEFLHCKVFFSNG